MNLIDAVKKVEAIIDYCHCHRNGDKDCNLQDDEVDAMRELVKEANRALGCYDYRDVKMKNQGSKLCAERLREVALSGEHSGRFGCAVMNEVADRIVDLFHDCRRQRDHGTLLMNTIAEYEAGESAPLKAANNQIALLQNMFHAQADVANKDAATLRAVRAAVPGIVAMAEQLLAPICYANYVPDNKADKTEHDGLHGWDGKQWRPSK